MLYKLESLRGFAAIMVLMYHLGISVSTKDLGFVKGSWLFVDFFFILSGFVMALAYENKIKEGLKFKDYFLKRFYRLFPLHAFILFLFLPLIGLKYILYNTGFGGTDPSLTENLKTFLITLFLLNSLGLEGGWNSPSWSISAEFVAYIIFYFIIFFLNSRKKTFIFCISVAISIHLFSYLFFGVFNFFTWDFGFLRSIPGFLLGVSLFIFFSNYAVSGNMFFKEMLAVSLLIGSVTLSSTNRAYSYLAILSFIICIYIFSSKEDG